VRALRSFPVTIGILAIVIAVGLLTAHNTPAQQRVLLDRIGMDLDALRVFRIWYVPVATFVQSSPGVEWHMLLLVALPLVTLEFLIGSLRTLVCFLASDWLTAPLIVLVLWVLSGLGSSDAARMIHEPDTGSSAAAHGVIACAIVLLPPRLALVCLAALLAISIYAFAFLRLDAAIAHLLGIAVGLCLGLIYRHRPTLHFG